MSLERQEYSLGASLLEVRGLSLALGGTPILRNLSADVKDIIRPGMAQGQIICLLGPSGMGKTQLFRCLAGLHRPTPDGYVQMEGGVFIDGRAEPVRAGEVGVVPQFPKMFRNRRIIGSLTIAAMMKGFSRKEALEKAREMLAYFQLSDKENLYPAQLSGGQLQRVAIIEQLLSSDYYLLMDEPFSGLDPIMKDAACERVLSVSRQDEKNTIIITTHDIETAIVIADTIWLLGRDRDERGKSLGANVKKIYDLAAMGLAWNPEIRTFPEFRDLALSIRSDFDSL